MMQSIGKHIEVLERDEGDKWDVWSKKGDWLGAVKWSARWKQYVFEPTEYSAFSHDCLDGMATFLQSLNKANIYGH